MSSGPFPVLRDSAGTVVLAWGDHTLNARARSLGFTALVLAAEGIQDPRHTLDSSIRVLRCPYYDNPPPGVSHDQNLEHAKTVLARCGPEVANLIEDGARVLVTCAAGENRSALMAAYTRHLLTGEPGADIFADMERAGPQGFSNNVFRRWVLTWPQETGRQTTDAWKKGLAAVAGLIAGVMVVRLLMI